MSRNARDESDGVGPALRAGLSPSANPTPPGSESRSHGQKSRGQLELVLVLAAMALVTWFYYWTAKANTGFEDWGDLDYYRLLVRGWRQGHLYVDKAPRPELLALADPYDPGQNGALRMGDMSLFRGHYYLYFGAAPAATLMLPWNLLTSSEMAQGTAVFVFCSVAFLAASVLWLSIRRRYFPSSSVVMAPLGVLALGFGTHLLVLVERPMFWELSIAGGIAFSILALVAIDRAIHGTRPLRAMALAGLCVGLAVGSRPTCLFAAPLLLAPLWLAWREGSSLRWCGRLAFAAALPLAACGVLLAAHNYARFGNPLEFGQHYQLSGAYEGKLTHFSARFLPHNLAVYFFQPIAWTWSFPFVLAEGIEINLPGYFGTEEVAGLAATLPFIWCLIGLPLVWLDRSREERQRLTAMVGAIAGGALPVALLLLAYFSTTTRYQADFALGIGLLATCGLLALEGAAQRVRLGFLATGGAVLLCSATVLMGALMAFDYHGRALRRNDPERWHRLEADAHRALVRLATAAGLVDGPRIMKSRFEPRPAGTVETFWRASDPDAKESIKVEHLGEHLIRFGYTRGERPVEWGRLLRWETGHTHTVEVQLPSLHRPPAPWIRGLVEPEEFRARSCVAVWFSGGRALGLVVDPLPASVVSGGSVGADFSGELRPAGTRAFRDEAEIGEPVKIADDAVRGGTLQLRVRFADPLAASGEPLFAVGAHYGSDIVFVRPDARGARFAFQHYGAPTVESDVVTLGSGEHDLELVLPSCRADAFGADAIGDVVLRLDGHEVLRTRQTCYAFPYGSEEIARNPFGTTCAREFSGWLLSARWVPRPRETASHSGP